MQEFSSLQISIIHCSTPTESISSHSLAGIFLDLRAVLPYRNSIAPVCESSKLHSFSLHLLDALATLLYFHFGTTNHVYLTFVLSFSTCTFRVRLCSQTRKLHQQINGKVHWKFIRGLGIPQMKKIQTTVAEPNGPMPFSTRLEPFRKGSLYYSPWIVSRRMAGRGSQNLRDIRGVAKVSTETREFWKGFVVEIAEKSLNLSETGVLVPGPH